MKIFKKAQIAGAVMLATAGIAVSTAQADSLLAPLVVDDSTWDTYFALKQQANSAGIHYTWIQKGTEWVHLMTDYVDLKAGPDNDDVAYGPRPCTMYDNVGVGSPNDLIFQDANGINGAIINVSAADVSVPNGYNNGIAIGPAGLGAFAGMAVISDMANLAAPGTGSSAPEGNFSGFAYVVNPGLNLLLDYKLLNNHHRAEDGDFSIQFISKHVVDLMWLPDNTVDFTPLDIPIVRPGPQNPSAPATNQIVDQFGIVGGGSLNKNHTTNWYAAVTGPDMSKHTSAQGGYNSVYGLQVTLGVNPFGGGLVVNERPGLPLESDPTSGFAQAYDNDENPLSGAPDFTITCAGMFQRDQFLTGPQSLASSDGGWARRSIIPLTDQFAGANTPKIASGAIIYRGDTFLPGGNMGGNPFQAGYGQMTLQIETSGHLNTNANHANRPY